MDEFQQQLASIGISNVPLVHAILVQQDISSLEQLNDVEAIQDLIQLNIPPQDAERLFKVSAKGSKTPNPSFTSKEEWLREAGLSEYAELRNIPLDGFRFLHKDDLTAELNFTLGKRNEVWKKLSQAIPLISQQFQPKFIGDNKAEIITIEPESSNRLAINHENWMTFMEAASANKCMLKIALVGPTGVGKSRLISELMPFQKRVLELKIPGVAAPGAVSPTTGNICLYLGEIKGAEVMLIDVEGMNGKTPESCKQRFALHKKELKELQEGRQKMVSTLFPQLVYLCANVIIYVDSARLHNSSYVERIEDFAAKSTITEGSGEKPKLLVVQNFANPSQQTDLSAYEVEASTSDFFTANKESGVIEKITMYYQGVKVVKMPEYQVNPQLYEEQLSRLKMCLMNCLHETASTSWMMKKNNFFSDKLWFEYVKDVVDQLSKDDKSKVSIREVLKRLWTPHNDAVKALKGFWDLISRKEIASELDYSTIVGLALQRLAVITLSALQETAHGGIKVEDLTKENLKQIIDQNFESFSALVTEWSPCLFGVRGRICGIPKCFHTSGHRTLRGSLSGVPNRPVPATPELPQFDFVVLRRQFDGFLQDYLNEVSGSGRKITIGAGRRSSFERSTFKRSINNLGLKILQEAKDKNLIVIERQGDSIEWGQCMICLVQFKSTTVSLMKCGHQYCKECGSKLHVCPLDGLASKEVDFAKRIPTLAGTRLLSLDGGGVRGIILVLVLQKLEVLTGFKIQDLFDYIIGTSVGGILALSLADRNVDLVSYLEFYEKMPKKIFNTGFGRKLLFWLPKYHVTDLQNAMYDNFRQRTFLEAVESSPLVAATTYDSNLNTPTPTLLANYFQYRHGESKVQIYYDLPMYKGATATAAAPTYFGSYTVAGKRFVDGGVVANNPAALGVDEMKSIWPNHPVDVVVSVGTGVTQDDTKASDDLVYWVKKFVSLATSPQNVHMKLSNTHGLNYFRVNPLLSKRIGLDTTDDKKLNQLVQDTMAYLVAPENLTHLKTIGKNLVSKLLYIDAPKELAMNNPPTILPIVNRAKVPFNQQRFGKYRLTCEVSGRRRNVISKLSFYETGDRVGDLSIAVESPEVLTINVFIHFNNDNDKYHISGSPATVTFYQNLRQPLPSK